MSIKISIRQQLETALKAWLSASFSASQEFTGVTFSKGQQSAEVTMPLCTAVCEDAQEEEEPGMGIYRVGASVVLMTTIDETEDPDAAHKARADLIANRLEDFDAVRSNINASGLAFVFGFGAVKSKHSVVERHFVDEFSVDIHCRCT